MWRIKEFIQGRIVASVSNSCDITIRISNPGENNQEVLYIRTEAVREQPTLGEVAEKMKEIGLKLKCKQFHRNN